MNEILCVILGAALGYFGAFIQYRLDIKKQRVSDLRLEKIKIYSNVISELSGLWTSTDELLNDLSDPVRKVIFRMRIGRLLGPARLIASQNLEEKIRELYEKLDEWFDDTFDESNKENKEGGVSSSENLCSLQFIVESMMRKEIEANM